MSIVLPYNRAQHTYAEALAARLRKDDADGLGIDRTEGVCPSCWLTYRPAGNPRRFGACPDCAADIGLS